MNSSRGIGEQAKTFCSGPMAMFGVAPAPNVLHRSFSICLLSTAAQADGPDARKPRYGESAQRRHRRAAREQQIGQEGEEQQLQATRLCWRRSGRGRRRRAAVWPQAQDRRRTRVGGRRRKCSSCWLAAAQILIPAESEESRGRGVGARDAKVSELPLRCAAAGFLQRRDAGTACLRWPLGSLSLTPTLPHSPLMPLAAFPAAPALPPVPQEDAAAPAAPGAPAHL